MNETIKFLRDKLQSWPGEMALTSTDVADLLAILNAHEPLMAVCRLAVESQGWDGNDALDDRWRDFYEKARAAKEVGDE